MAKIAFTPVNMISGLIAGLIASRLYGLIWSRFTDQDAPDPEQREVSWPALLLGLALEGAILRFTRGIVSHGTRVAFARATGSWPGEERPESVVPVGTARSRGMPSAR